MTKLSFFSLLLIISAIMFLPFTTKAQITIGSTADPQSFSVLELISNDTRGFRLPQMTTFQRDSVLMQSSVFQAQIDSLAMGLTIFNTCTRCVETWNGREWISLCWGDTPDPCAGLERMDTIFCLPFIIDHLTERAREEGGRGTIRWFSTATGDTPISPNTSFGSGTHTFYADNCAGATTRTPVTVRIMDCPPIIEANIRVTAFVNVLYDFQPQRLETWTTAGSEATSVQWQVSTTDNPDDFSNIADDVPGATSAVFTLPPNFIHRREFADNVDYLYFRTVKTNPAGTVEQSDHFLQIRFIRTTNREGTAFLRGFGMDENGVRYVTMSRARHLGTGPDTIHVALLNLGATDNYNVADDVGLGDHFQWGRIADGHQTIVWGKTTGRTNIRTNTFASGVNGTSGTRARTPDMTEHVDPHTGQATGDFAGNFITGSGDWGTGAPDRNRLWGNAQHVSRATSPVSLDGWTVPANNPCAVLGPDWRVPSPFDFFDMHNGTGTETMPAAGDYGPTTGNNDNTWTWREHSTGAVGGAILNAPSTGGTLFLPAVGWRASNGVVGGVDGIHRRGCLWTSSFSFGQTGNAMDMCFNPDTVTAGGSTGNRANGASVRCVR